MSGPDLQHDRAQMAKEIFADACDLPSEKRRRLLDDCCGGDSRLRAEVEALLRANDTAGRFLSEPAAATEKARIELPDEFQPESLPRRVNQFNLVRLLGEGGFGAVYLAEQEYPVRRTVAFKIIKLGMDTRQVVARFEAEWQALALMDHPNIATVFDAGATDTGRPYFVMELVDGVTIIDYCRAHRLSVLERLELFIPVCQAVGHAHQKGVIHRDIKPSNILVITLDGTPVPKVIDFGVAKATQDGIDGRTEATAPRQLIGTLQYMSPEQADLVNPTVDTRSDIYSLGVVLYELLTGSAPIEGALLRQKGYSEAQRILREVQPPRPSSRVTSGAQGADAGRATGRLLRGDLDWIVMKCLEKDRDRRYETAAALVNDLQRYLRGEPVSAGPATAAYRLRKFLGRHRAAATVVAALIFGLMATAIGTSIGFFHARAAQKRAEVAERGAEMSRRNAEQSAQQAAREAGRAAAVNDLLRGIFALAQPESGTGGANARIDEVLRRASVTIDQILRNRPEDQVNARKMLADAADRVYLRDVAAEQLRRAHELSASLPGGASSPRSLDLAARWHLETYLNFQGAAAAPAARQTLSQCRRVLGDHDPITWEAMQACALCVSQAGATGECHRLLVELVDLTQSDPRAQTPQRLGRYLCNLAASLRDRGDFTGAAEALRQAISLPGASSPDQILAHGWVVRELVESMDLPEAQPLLESQIAAARKADPVGTPTLCYRLEDLAMLQLRRDNAVAAGQAYSRAIEMNRAVRGRLDLNDQSRWRSWTLWCDPTFTEGWRSQALRDQVYCALDALLHDYPPARLDRGEGLAQLRFTLIPWGQTQSGESHEGGLAELKSLPEPSPGTYLLGLEVPRLGNAPLRRAQWLLFAPWKLEFQPVVRFDEIRMDSSRNDRDLTGVVGPVYQTSYAPALALQDGLAVRTGSPNRLQWFTVNATARAHFAAGRYRFSTTSDDGARLWVDGAKVIDDWRPHPPATTDGYIDLSEGNHELRAELFQETGGFSLWLQAAPMTAAARTTALALGGGVPEADWLAIWMDQLTDEFPNELRFPLLCAQALVRGGRFDEARQQYRRLAELNPGTWEIVAEQIPLLAYLQDGSAYQRACASAVDRLGGVADPLVRVGLVQACCLSTEPPIALLKLKSLIANAPTAGIAPEVAARWQLAAGMANVRMGDFSAAMRDLTMALAGLPQNASAARATAEMFASIALRGLGNNEAAREALGRGDALIANLPIAGVDDLDHSQAADWLACHAVRRELAPASR